MASRNQSRAPRSPATRRGHGDENPLDKRRRLGAVGRGLGPTGTGQTRRAFSAVNNLQEATTADNADAGNAEECHEFTKEEVEAILNERPKAKKFDLKLEKKNKEEELNAVISELRDNNASLQEMLSKEVSEKQDAINLHRSEIEARLTAEKTIASLTEELQKAQQDIAAANERATSLDNTHKRLQEYILSLQQYNSKLITDLDTVRESLKCVEKEKLTIVENLSTLRGHCSSLQEQLTLSRASQDDAVNQKETLVNEFKCLRGELQQVRDDRECQTSKVQALSAEIVKFKESAGKSFEELDDLTMKSKYLEDTCSSQRERIRIQELQLAAANEKLKELKGNIRVFCRVRPLLPDDGAAECVAVSYPTSTESLGRGIDLIQNGQKYPFTFDKVFNPEASQQDVFVEISQLVQSALDGYKVCIFAYGQTGSGKTYTMMGRPEAPEQKGLIPRSLEQIFQSSQSLQAQGWKYKMQASMLEIYNETIRDLLSTNRSIGSDSTRSESAVSGKQYTIKHDLNGNTYVSDLTIVDVSTITEISSLLRLAAQSRSVGRTQMNEQSSRSHMVFTLRISGMNEGTEQQLQGVLNLIDLAGSERLSKSGATGDRLKETQAINKSLSCLSDVIFALAKKEDHVPFRNSKLTYLLQVKCSRITYPLSSVCLVLVEILKPLCLSMYHRIRLLWASLYAPSGFAARVNACEIGVPRRQMTLRAADSRLSCG
ncbi:Kinesin-1 [Hibiscus syriacus]|uniref:Kinesin-like protein n=1 Tax=Hibiscus syriacus TaxID=106335 RepID=A0A6A3AVP1_HIBSY|nr:Kinesin-1 [Hibiscus syriacus]